METLHSLLVSTHIAVGAVVLVLFWVPAFARKGSRLHVSVGKIYVQSMYVVVATAFVASLLVLSDPIGIRHPGEALDAIEADDLAASARVGSLFLLMLSVLVFASVRHGIRALRERQQPGSLRRPWHLVSIALLGVMAVIVGFVGLRNGIVLLMIFAGISLAAAISMFRDTRVQRPNRRAQLVAHLNGLIGSGIGIYTAFFAFGGSRFLADLLTGYWMLVPWVLPAIIGTIVIRRLERSYKRPVS